MRHFLPLAAASLALATAVLAGEPTVRVEDPVRADVGPDAALLTSETLAFREYRDFLTRVPMPDSQAVGGPAMIGLSTIPAARVRRGDAPAEVLERLKTWDGWGAAVVRVLPGSPAEAAWLQAGDVIVRMSGIWVDRADTLTWLASRSEPFRETELWYWREGQVYRTWITPDARDKVQAAGEGRDEPIERRVLELGFEGLVPPRLDSEVDVEYPSAARRRGEGGIGLYRIVVGIDGDVLSATVKRSTGREDLDQAAVEALRERRYEPGRFRGHRIGVGIDVVVSFWPDGLPEVELESSSPGG